MIVIKCDRCHNALEGEDVMHIIRSSSQMIRNYFDKKELVEDVVTGLQVCEECYEDIFSDQKPVPEYDEHESDYDKYQQAKLDSAYKGKLDVFERKYPNVYAFIEAGEKSERIEKAKSKSECLDYQRNLDIGIPNKPALLELLGATRAGSNNTFKYVYKNGDRWMVWISNSNHDFIIGYYDSEIIAVRALYSWIVENDLEEKYFNNAGLIINETKERPRAFAWLGK